MEERSEASKTSRFPHADFTDSEEGISPARRFTDTAVRRPTMVSGGRDHIKIDMPRFNGDNPRGWLYKVECFFQLHDFIEYQKLMLALVYMDDPALSWFQWADDNKQLHSWQQFKTLLLQRFGHSPHRDLREKMGIGIEEFQETKLKESDIDTSTSIAIEIESQAPNATKHEVDAQPPEIKELEILSQQPKQSKGNAKETLGGSSYLSFLNGIGVIGSGVLGALFATSQQEKKALESTIEFMTANANDQEIAAASMKQSFEADYAKYREMVHIAIDGMWYGCRAQTFMLIVSIADYHDEPIPIPVPELETEYNIPGPIDYG